MKVIYFFSIYLFSLNLFGQESSEDKVIRSIRVASQTGDFRLAKKICRDFILSNPSLTSENIAIHYFSKIQLELEEYDTAIALYHQRLNEYIPTIFEYNYRHDLARRLAEFYIYKKDFKNALVYLDSSKNFPARFECGVARMEDYVFLKCLYSDCYVGQKDCRKAIDSLTPLMFCNAYAPGKKLASRLYNALLNVYSNCEVKTQFIDAIKSIKIEKEKKGDYIFLRPTIKLFNCEVNIPDNRAELHRLTELQQIQKCAEIFMSSDIYKLATFDAPQRM